MVTNQKQSAFLEPQLAGVFGKEESSYSHNLAKNAWWIVMLSIIVQPFVDWAYWNDVRSVNEAPNTFLYAALAVSGLAILLQLLALPYLMWLQKKGWNFVYYSVFLILLYGVLRIFSNQGSIGPFLGMAVVSVIFFFFLFKIRPPFKSRG